MIYHKFNVGDAITWNPEFKDISYGINNENKSQYKRFGPTAVFTILEVGPGQSIFNASFGRQQRITQIRFPNEELYTCLWFPERFMPAEADLLKLSVSQLSRMIRNAGN